MINEVRICHEGRWRKKHLASLKIAYANAPFFKDHKTFLEDVFSEHFEKLIDLNLNIIRHLMKHIRISTRVMQLSELGIEAHEPQLSVEICKHLGASHFLAQNSAKRYLDEEAFRKAGIDLKLFNPRPAVYPQLWGPFITNLSTFDLLFNCGPKAFDILCKA
jgi:hypothetical protein